MAFGDVHVVYRVETDQWLVKVEGSNVNALHETKWEAVRAGRARVGTGSNGADLLVHARVPAPRTRERPAEPPRSFLEAATRDPSPGGGGSKGSSLPIQVWVSVEWEKLVGTVLPKADHSEGTRAHRHSSCAPLLHSAEGGRIAAHIAAHPLPSCRPSDATARSAPG
jgi:hypothetical protein